MQLFRKVTAIKNFLFSRSGCSVEVLLREKSYSEKNGSGEKVAVLKKEEKAAVPEKQPLRKDNCCVERVTLKKCKEVASPKINLCGKSGSICEKGNRYLKKKTKLDQVYF